MSTPASKSGTIGHLIAGVEARIVNEDGVDVKSNSADRGELWIKGDVVMKGYWRNRAATEGTMSGPWFKTGDVVVRDTDGFYL